MIATAAPAVVVPDLAAEITREHEAACRAVRTGLEHARRAGELLTGAKAGLVHGAWLQWLAEHCPTVSPRTAQMYMRVAGRWPELEAAANTKHVSHLPIRQAVALLAGPRELPALVDGDEIDWTVRTAVMEEAWDDLGAALDDLQARIGQATSLDEAADNFHTATELEGQTIALYASTIRDSRHVTRTLAKSLKLPIERVRPFTAPERMDAFLAACRSRLVELEAAP